MRQAFISYSHADAPVANELARELDEHGVRVFIDTDAIGLSESIRRAIEDGIATSFVVILLASPESLASEWVQHEIEAALRLEAEQDIRLLVVRLRECDLPKAIEDRLCLSVPDQLSPDALATLLEAVQPSIFPQAGKHRVTDFGGDGGSASVHLEQDEIGACCRIEVHVPHDGAFAGVFWEPTRGGLDIGDYDVFRWQMRGEPLGTLVQLKLESKGAWETHVVKVAKTAWQTHEVPLKESDAAARHVERVTIAIDDRGMPSGQTIARLSVRGFHLS